MGMMRAAACDPFGRLSCPQQPSSSSPSSYHVERYGRRYFCVREGAELVCVTLYRKGAEEVRRRLEKLASISTQDTC